jgi:polygalacturonase
LKGSTINGAGVITLSKTMADYESVKDFLRPNMVVITGCDKVLLEGVTFQNSPAWNLHPLMTTNLTVRNVYAKNPWYAQNGDGIDVESCSNVLIESSTFDVGDDGICIKSGRDEAGRKRGMPTQNLIVRNCTVYHAHGGFVIGSEMSGGVKNMYVSNCSFIGTDIGLRFKTNRGRGGIVENVFIKNINMKDIAAEAILFDMYYEAKDPVVLAGERREPPKVQTLPVTEATPQFRNFYVKDIVCDGAEKAIFIRGIPEMNVQNVYLKDMVLQAKEGLDFTEASGIHLKNIKLITKNTNPVATIHNSQDITLDNISYPDNTKLLFDIQGDKAKNIVVSKTDVSKAQKKTEFNFGANDKALQIK